MIKKYTSKVSYGLLIFMFLLFYLPVLPNIFVVEINEKTIGLISFETVFFNFTVNLFLNTVYSIEKTSLKIICGVFSYRPIDITLIKESFSAYLDKPPISRLKFISASGGSINFVSFL